MVDLAVFGQESSATGAALPNLDAERLANFLVLMRAVIDADGVQAGVRLANGWTAHRYTGLYCIEHERLVCLALWDKAQATMTSGGDVAVYESFCIYILQSGNGFTVLDAVSDARLAGHPKRTVYRSYCGAPLIDREGRVVGTFCHFDEVPGRVAPADFELVHIAAALLSARMMKDNRVLCGHSIATEGLCRDSTEPVQSARASAAARPPTL